MHIVTIGMNHQTAPIEMRERLALAEESQSRVLAALSNMPPIEEAVVLSTCNRLEVYAAVSAFHGATEAVVDLLAERAGIVPSELMSYLYVHSDLQAARHLFRVTCGLDAMVLGETQILGQVRQAYQLATDEGTVGKLLHELFQRALRVGKRAHTETAISRSAASISSAALQLVRDRLGSLSGRRVVIIGAGEMARLSAEQLLDIDVDDLVFVNRTLARATDLAKTYGGRAMALSDLPVVLRQADVVLVSTASPEYVITDSMAQEAVAERQPEETMLIMDIAVPRNVDPAVDEIAGIILYDIDDLQSVVEENLRQRELEAPKVEAIIRNEVANFNHWLREQQIVPLIRSLRKKAEEIRQGEVQRLFDRLPDLDNHTRELIELTTVSIVNKILNEPTVRLRKSLSGDQGDLYAQALANLFNLAPALQESSKAPVK